MDALPPGQAVPSPCVGICRLTDEGTSCLGCGRTLEEIANWARSSESYRREVWRRITAARVSDDG